MQLRFVITRRRCFTRMVAEKVLASIFAPLWTLTARHRKSCRRRFPGDVCHSDALHVRVLVRGQSRILENRRCLEALCCSVAVQFVRIILDLQSVFVGLVWVYRLVIGLIVVSCTKGIA